MIFIIIFQFYKAAECHGLGFFYKSLFYILTHDVYNVQIMGFPFELLLCFRHPEQQTSLIKSQSQR